MKYQTTQVIGWIGVALVLLAYFLVSFNFISNSSVAYPILNLLGSLAILYETFTKKDYQPTTLNIIWALIAIVSLARFLFY